MSLKIELKILPAPNVASEVLTFYNQNERSATINPSDTFVLAYAGSHLVGAVRLSYENHTYLLRTMQVKEEFQGKGIGHLMLKEFNKILVEKNVKEVFCMPHKHLEYFYGLIEFKKIEDQEIPGFLQDNMANFKTRNPSKEVIIMRKKSNTSA